MAKGLAGAAAERRVESERVHGNAWTGGSCALGRGFLSASDTPRISTMPVPRPVSRRRFLGAASSVTAALAFPALLRSAPGGSPGQRLNVACVGVGGRGWAAVQGVSSQNLVAFADVDDVRAARTFREHPDVPRFRDYRVMLERLAGRFGHRLRPMRDVLVGSPFGATLALRLLPIGNNLAVNLLAGMAAVPFVAFLLASAIGYVPQTVIFALLGKGIRVDGAWQMGLAAALFVVSVLIGLWLLRRHRAGRVLEDQTESF